MFLNYYREQPNFGDALNPLIFHKLLPNFFDDDVSIEFSGIGSIIGLEMSAEAKKRIIFSSGFAYGTLPNIDDTFDIICVRGPLTAEALKIDKKLGIVDGAALLRQLSFPISKKRYKFSFMPHWESELKYPWKSLCEKAGIHYLSPLGNTLQLIDDIIHSEVVLAEAMHAAIAADALRTPWVPVKAYGGINDFKWNDWTQSLSMPYHPSRIRSMYKVNDFVLKKVMREKIGNKLPEILHKPTAHFYTAFQDTFLEAGTVKQLEDLKKTTSYLSDEKLFNSKVDQLLEKLDYVKLKYGNSTVRSQTY